MYTAILDYTGSPAPVKSESHSDALLQLNTTGSDSLPGGLQGWVPTGALEEILL